MIFYTLFFFVVVESEVHLSGMYESGPIQLQLLVYHILLSYGSNCICVLFSLFSVNVSYYIYGNPLILLYMLILDDPIYGYFGMNIYSHVVGDFLK